MFALGNLIQRAKSAVELLRPFLKNNGLQSNATVALECGDDM